MEMTQLKDMESTESTEKSEKGKRRGCSFRRKACLKSGGAEGEKCKRGRWGKMKDASLEARQERLNAKLLRLKKKLSEIDALAAEKKQPKKEKECQTDNKNNSNGIFFLNFFFVFCLFSSLIVLCVMDRM